MIKPLLPAIIFIAGCGASLEYNAQTKDTGTTTDTSNSTIETAYDSGNKDTSTDTGKDTIETGIYDTISPIITNVYADSATPSTTDTFIVYATITDNVAISNASLNIDAITTELTDDNNDDIYSSAITASQFAYGTYSLQITATDSSGNTAINTEASVEIKKPIPCSYECRSRICLYVDGIIEAEVNTSYPPQMTKIDTIRIGYSNQSIDNLMLKGEADSYVNEDFSTSKGCFNTGSVNSGVYISEGTDNDCSFSPAFDATTEHWMVSVDVLAGSTPNFALRSSLYSSPGVNWDFAANGYLNDGAGNNVPFTSGTPNSSKDHTIIMCNSTIE